MVRIVWYNSGIKKESGVFMNSNLLKILFTTDNKKLEEKRKKRQAKSNAEKEKRKMEYNLWVMAEEYEEED